MANPIKTCWLCGMEAELSREHIAPNQLGFTATTRSFSCHSCNSKMGKLEEQVNDIARIANTIKAYSRADNDLDRMADNRDPRNKPWTDSEGRKILGDRITFESDSIEEPFEGTLKSIVESSSSQSRGLWMFLAVKGALSRISREKGLSEYYQMPWLQDALDRLRRYINDPQPSAWQGLPYIEAQPWGPLGIARLMIYCPREENTRLPSIYGAFMYSSLFTWFRLADNVENCPPFALGSSDAGKVAPQWGRGIHRLAEQDASNASRTNGARVGSPSRRCSTLHSREKRAGPSAYQLRYARPVALRVKQIHRRAIRRAKQVRRVHPHARRRRQAPRIASHGKQMARVVK